MYTPFVLAVAVALSLTVSLPSFAAIELVHYGYSGHGEAFREYVEQRAREFERLHPDVKIQILAQGSYTDNYLVMSAGGIAPDISEFNDRDGGDLQAQGMFLDLTPYFDRGINVDFLPVSLSAFTWSDGSIWGFPIDSGPNITLFNRDLFDQYGLLSPDEHPDEWTWEYAKEAGQLLTRDLNGDGSPDQWGIANTERMWAQSTPVRQAGGHLFNRVTNPTESRFDSSEVLRGLEFLVELGQLEVVTGTPNFRSGKAGFQVTHAPSVIQNWFGTMEGSPEWQWGMALPLKGPDNRGTLIFSNGFQISRTSQHPDLAMKWIEFLVGNTDATDEFVRTAGRISANRHSLPAVAETMALSEQMLGVIGETMSDPESYPNYAGPGVEDIRRLFTSQVNTRVLRGGESPRNVLLELHQQATAILEDAHRR